MLKKRKGSKPITKRSNSTKPAPKPKPAPKSKPDGYEFGRPTKYDPKYCAAIVKHSGKWGGTLASFAISIEVHTDTLAEWAKVHKDFSAAMRRAKQIQEEVMVKEGLRGIRSPRFFGNQTWAFMMKARFGWREDGPQDREQDEMEFDLE